MEGNGKRLRQGKGVAQFEKRRPFEHRRTDFVVFDLS